MITVYIVLIGHPVKTFYYYYYYHYYYNYYYILELTVGFESNFDTNATRKHSKYASLLSDLQRQFKCVSFVNLSMSSLGIFGNSYNSFFKMCDSLSIDQQQKRYLISKLSNIAICSRCYYILLQKLTMDKSRITSFLILVVLFFPFYLTIVIVLSCKTRLANCKLPCNSKICNCSLS